MKRPLGREREKENNESQLKNNTGRESERVREKGITYLEKTAGVFKKEAKQKLD